VTRFIDLPVGQARVVDFAADASVLEQLTPREQRDQFRDWLLYAVASSAGLTPGQLSESLYDVPALRHGYVRAVANFDYVETRSCSIAEGHVLALIPACDDPRRAALLAEVADAHRKNLGAEPRTFSVVEYELDPVGQSAKITRREDLDAHTLFTADAGYRQATVQSLADLERFLESVNDVTYASTGGGSLVLGGRKIANYKPPQVRAEDVAAVWQAERKIYKEETDFRNWIQAKQDDYNAESERQFNALKTRWEQKIDRINERIKAGLARIEKKSPFNVPSPYRKKKSPYDVSPFFSPDSGNDSNNETESLAEQLRKMQGLSPSLRQRLAKAYGLASEDDLETAAVIDQDEVRRREEQDFAELKAARKAKWMEVEAEVVAEKSKHKLLKGSGFSLDPDYDFEGLASFVGSLVSELEGFVNGTGRAAITDAELGAIRDALKKGDLGPYRTLLERLEGSDGPLARALYNRFRSAQVSARSRGDVDAEGLDRLLSRLETDLGALHDGRWPDGSPSDFRPIRAALAAGDEAPFRAWLGRMKGQDGPLARAAWNLVSEADDRYHSRSVADRAGLDAWLGRLEAEARALADGRLPSATSAELRRAADAAQHGRDEPAKTLATRWKKSDEFLQGALGDVLDTWLPSYRYRGRLDNDGLARLFARLDKGLQSLTVGDRALLSSGAVCRVREALAKGDDAPFRTLVERMKDARPFVDEAVGSRLARATTRFRACDHAGLASFLGEAADWARGLAGGDAPALAAGEVKQTREALKGAGSFALDYMMLQLGRSDNKFASALAKEMAVASNAYRDQNLGELAESLRVIGPEVRGLASLAPLGDLRAASRVLSGETRASQGRGKEADQAVVPLLVWNDQLRKAENTSARFLAATLQNDFRTHRFQMARYDGDLKGTEVGMVLFYTDLLAKLWAIDFMHAQPARVIEDFEPMTALKVSPVFEEEIRKLPSTRLWFGHEDKGFQVAGDGNALILARNATRIYAASSNPLAPGEEVPAAASSEAFLGWWNDHYLDVARFEPQYERLNEVMKWSLLISWLNEKDRGDALGFLGDVTVDHSRWFPNWVRQQPELRFRRWDRVSFYEPGYKGSTTEALPILSSDPYVQFGTEHTLSGGVSLAPKEIFKSRAALTGEVNPLLRRSNVNYASRAATAEGVSFKTLQESRYVFRPASAGRAAMEAVPKEGTKLRGRMAEVMTPRFERIVTAESGQWEVAAKVGDHDLAVLSVRPTKNGLRVGLKSRDLATGQALARRASVSFDPLDAVARHADVEAALGTPEGVFARLRGSKSWLKLTAEKPGAAGVESTKGSVARVADSKAGAQTYDLAFVDQRAPKAALDGGNSVSIHVPESGGDGLPIRLSARGPPADAPLVPVEVEWSGGTLRGRFDSQTRQLHVSRELLPGDLLDNPERFRNLIRKSGLPGLKVDPKQTGTVRLVLDEVKLAQNQTLIDIENGKFRPVAERPTGDSAGFSEKIRSDYDKALHASDDLIRGGEHERALWLLYTVEDVFGGQPEIRFRQAVAEINAGRPGRAARLANEALNAPRADYTKLYEELSIRLSDPHLDPATRTNLGRLRDASEWHHLQAAGKTSEGQVVLTADGERLDLVYRVKGDLSLGEAVPEERVLKSASPVYIVDLPGFNNLDWTPSFQETLHGLVQGGTVKIVSLPDAAIAEFHPTRIFAGEKTATVTASKTTAYTNVRPSPASAYSSARGPSASLNNPGDDDEEKKRKRRLAALLAGETGPAPEAFVILPASSQ
jgi:hypothetical protein